MEAANLTVSINGDSSGLSSAIASANASIGLLKTSASNALASLTDKTVSINAVDNTAVGIASARQALNSLQNKTVTVSVNYKTSSLPFAKGTQNAPQGMALINDESGIIDPRELIYHNGKYMMYQDRDVIVPLDQGDKVYTASQTKAIMKGLGIPNYASGLNNEMFKMESDNFNSYTKSNNVSIDEQIAWWKDALERYSYDYEVIKDCNEEIFYLTRKLVDNLNDVSDIYVDERTYFNDWETYEDTAIDAFQRIKDRNSEFLKSGVITWDEYCENVSNLGNKLYEGRIEQSENWLEHEEKYNGLTVDDYIAGLERMAAYSKEYYNNGLISYREYCDGINEINDSIADKTSEKNESVYSEWQSSSQNWFDMREIYDDWETYGDSQVKFYKRCIERISELYKEGVIDWQTYSDETMNYNMDLYKAQEDELDELLSQQADYISQLSKQFSDEEQELQDSWAIEDRTEDISDVKSEMKLYKNAVTSAGKEKYQELQDQLEQLNRDEELYELQEEHKEILEDLNDEYEEVENQKSKLLQSIKYTNYDIYDICATISENSDDYRSNITSLLSNVLSAINNLEVNIYNDNSTTTNNSTGDQSSGNNYSIAWGYYG